MLLFALLPLRALADDVVVFGDSWAEGSADELEDALHDHGRLSVDPRGVGGTTAEYWADSSPSTLPDAVSANPDARWVWLSIGGNDLFQHYYAGNGAQNAADYDTHLRLMLDGLFAVHPDIKVVSFGYDFVNFEQSEECILTAWTYFGTSITTGTVNQYFLDQIGGTLAAVDADYPNFTYVDSVWGTLQAAGDVPGAPNVLLPSPSKYMSDCIHPTSEGYSLIHEAFVEDYWGLPEPGATIDGPTDVCVGDPATFTGTTPDAQVRTWTLDGVAAGSDPTLAFTALADVTVGLRADSGAWTAEDSVELHVWAIPAPTITGPAEVEVGAAATYRVESVAGETLVWTAPGATVIDDAGDTLVVRWDDRGDYLVRVEVGTPGDCAGAAELAIVAAAVGDTGDTNEAADTGESSDTGGSDPGCGCGGGGVSGSTLAWAAALVGLARRRRR